MKWTPMMEAFADELEKIAAVSLSGLSPETVLNHPQPEPMVTTGLDKARAIIAKAEMFKTAARKKPQPIIQGYNLPTVGQAPAPDQKNIWDKAKPGLGHTLAGPETI